MCVCVCVCVCDMYMRCYVCSCFQTRLSQNGGVDDVTNQEVDQHTNLTTSETTFSDLPAKNSSE